MRRGCLSSGRRGGEEVKPCSKRDCSWERHERHALGAFRAVSMLQICLLRCVQNSVSNTRYFSRTGETRVLPYESGLNCSPGAMIGSKRTLRYSSNL